MQDVAARGPASIGATLPAGDGAVAGFLPAGIVSVVGISPTSYANVAPPIGAAPFFLIYGAADGDVNGFISPSRGAMPPNLFDGIWPLRHLDRATSNRAAIIVDGANHNYFNSSWPSDDFATGVVPTRRTRPEQEALARAYVLAWLRYVDQQSGAGDFFRHPPSRLRPLGTGAYDLWGQFRPETTSVVALDNYELFTLPTQSSTGEPVSSVGLTSLNEYMLQDTDLADDTTSPNRFAQETRGAILAWPGAAELVIDVPPGARDFRARQALSLRAAQEPFLSPGGATSFTVRLEDGAGATVSLPSAFATSIAPVYAKTFGPDDPTIAFFQTVRVALDRFTVGLPNFDMSDVRRIRLVFAEPGTPATGRIAIDDIELE